MNKKLTPIGYISKAQGFNGEVLCILETDVELNDHIRFLFLNLDGKPVPFFIEYKKEKNGGIVFKFEDVNDEASAKKLSGQRVSIESDFIKAVKSTLQWKDLVGYSATDINFGALGTIISVEEFPEQMLATSLVKGKEVLFPLNDNLILDINTEDKIILLDLPEGLLDIYLNNEK